MSESLTEMLSRALTKEGYTVDLAASGEQAMEMIRKNPYDCIVTDLRMPGMGGQELYMRIRDLDPALAENIIFMTGDTARTETKDFFERIENPVVEKPLVMEELCTLIQAQACAKAANTDKPED